MDANKSDKLMRGLVSKHFHFEIHSGVMKYEFLQWLFTHLFFVWFFLPVVPLGMDGITFTG